MWYHVLCCAVLQLPPLPETLFTAAELQQAGSLVEDIDQGMQLQRYYDHLLNALAAVDMAAKDESLP
jgi:hypothetical protein